MRLVLHDGSHKDVKVGDVIIQVGNIHQWVNVSDEPARASAFEVCSEFLADILQVSLQLWWHPSPC
jgi:quercetin dioxygenase-like cupin family protein